VIEEKAQWYASVVKWYMQNPPLKEWFGIDFGVPLVADIGIGDNYADIEELPSDLPEIIPDFYNKKADLYENQIAIHSNIIL
jgi:hypothetical protein